MCFTIDPVLALVSWKIASIIDNFVCRPSPWVQIHTVKRNTTGYSQSRILTLVFLLIRSLFKASNLILSWWASNWMLALEPRPSLDLIFSPMLTTAWTYKATNLHKMASEWNFKWLTFSQSASHTANLLFLSPRIEITAPFTSHPCSGLPQPSPMRHISTLGTK